MTSQDLLRLVNWNKLRADPNNDFCFALIRFSFAFIIFLLYTLIVVYLLPLWTTPCPPPSPSLHRRRLTARSRDVYSCELCVIILRCCYHCAAVYLCILRVYRLGRRFSCIPGFFFFLLSVITEYNNIRRRKYWLMSASFDAHPFGHVYSPSACKV